MQLEKELQNVTLVTNSIANSEYFCLMTIYLIPLLIGFLAGFVGLMAPSMLNMTTARTSIERGRAAGVLFAAGAASTLFAQGLIAVLFAKYFVAHPEIITKLKTAAIVVLSALAVFFYIQARKEFRAAGKVKQGNPYLSGLLMSSLNMLAIPFHLAMVTLAESKSWMQIVMPYSFLYVLGAVLGAFSLFALYAYFANIIAQRASFIAQNINYILSGLFVVLAGLTAYQVLV
ncbi:MAG: LysE family translocator [Flavobacteriaceae bacterium]|nr:LysE family translocator [Flavobacteriaceae bacterium]